MLGRLPVKVAVLAALFTFAPSLDSDVMRSEDGAIYQAAQARIGRPLTPGSYAGVARRTTRRVVRRSAIYVSTLPPACVTVSLNGATYWRCGGTYYQAYGGRYVVVNVY